MKKQPLTFALTLMVMFFSLSVMAQSPMVKTEKPAAPAVDAKKPAPAVKWAETTHNFGDIKKNVPVTHDFTFVNTSKETVLITNVKASCGCTATNYTKTPIKPGETGFVSAKYDARNPGAFSKNVRVMLNESEDAVNLIIKGKVIDEESK